MILLDKGGLLHWLLKPDILGTHLFLEGPRGWVPDVGHKFITLQGETPYLWDPSWLWVAPPRVGTVVRSDIFQRDFMSFSEGNFAYVAVVLLCPWEELSSGPHYATVLYCLPWVSFYYLNWPTLPTFSLKFFFCFYYKRIKAHYSNIGCPVPILPVSAIQF